MPKEVRIPDFGFWPTSQTLCLTSHYFASFCDLKSENSICKHIPYLVKYLMKFKQTN